MNKESIKSIIICFLYFNLLFLNKNIHPENQKNTDGWIKLNGPSGGFISDIAIDDKNPEIMYAAGSKKGIYKSENRGANWELLPFKSYCWNNDKIEIDPANTSILYSKYDKFSKSFDCGITWKTKSKGIDNDVWISDFFINPENNKEIYSCGNNYNTGKIFVYKSNNGGDQWEKINGNLPEIEGLVSVSIILSQRRLFYAVNDNSQKYWKGGKVFYSDNEGKSWKELNYNNSVERNIKSLFVNPLKKDEVWLSEGPIFNQGIKQPLLFKSNDNGKSWIKLAINTFFDSTQVRVIGAGKDGSVYLGCGSNLLYTKDGGKTFVHVLRASQRILGVDFTNIAVNQINPEEIFLPLRASGIAYSVDHGKNWKLNNNGIVETSINLLYVDPKNPATVYCSSVKGEGTFRSDDYGETWKFLNDGGIIHAFTDELMVEEKNNSKVWYIGDVPYIFKSSNKGENWELIANPIEKNNFNFSSVYAIAQPEDKNIMYALNNGFGIFRGNKSDNSDWNWSFLNLSEIDYTYSIVCQPDNPGIIYSGYIPKPFQDWAMIRKSNDSGKTWETVLKVNDSKGITTIAIDKKNPDIIYAGSIGKQGQILKSSDSGKTWKTINKYANFCTIWGQAQLTLDHSNPSEVYITTWLAGSWVSEDAGKSWKNFKDAPISGTSIAINETNSNEIYISDRSSPTVWKSEDKGLGWKKIADFSKDGALLVMRVIAHNSTIYAATFHPRLMGGKMYRSFDGGNSWKDITNNLPRGVLDIAIDKTNPEILYVATNISGLYKTINSGDNWTKIDTIPYIGIYDIEIDPYEPDTIYASARGGSLPSWFTEIAGIKGGIEFKETAGVYRSTNKGLSWEKILETKASCRTIRIHPQYNNLLFAVDIVDGLLSSNDRGKTWGKIRLPVNNIVATSCIISQDKIYLGTQGCGVFSGNLIINQKNNQCKVIWQDTNSNKPIPEVFSMQILIDPSDSDAVFLSAYPGGVFRCEKDGTLKDLNAINPSVVVEDPLRQGYYTLEMSPHDQKEIWVGTWGKGIYKSYNSMLLNIPMNGEDNIMIEKHITGIKVSPLESKTVYVTSEEGVFITNDGGLTWNAKNKDLPTADIKTILINSSGDVYIGTKGYGLYKLTGDTWLALNAFGNFGVKWPMWDDRPLYQYTSILAHPDSENKIMIGTFPQGIYISNNGGKNWKESNIGWSFDGVFRLVSHPTKPDTVYAGTYNAINVSYDFGRHWKIMDNGWPKEQWVFSIDFDFKDPQVMYACSKNGANEGQGVENFHGIVMKSEDGGNTWKEIMKGLDKGQEFYEIIVDKKDNNIIYCASQRQGIMRSVDAGKTWNDWNEGLTNKIPATNGNNVTHCFALSKDGSTFYFGSDGSGVYRRKIIRNH